MAKMFTDPDDYVLSRVNAYPCLYASDSFENTKLLVLDQLLNVIGNGVRDAHELRRELRWHEFDRERGLRLCSGESVAWGYYEVEDWGNGFLMGRGESISAVLSERHLHPEVVHWLESKPIHFDPYPNFQKEYSIVWQGDFLKLNKQWRTAADWFYERCELWFQQNENHYHRAYPRETPAKSQQYLKDMQEQRGHYDSDAAFSEAYGIEYHGDMEDFMRRRWQCEKQKISEFIAETREYLA